MGTMAAVRPKRTFVLSHRETGVSYGRSFDKSVRIDDNLTIAATFPYKEAGGSVVRTLEDLDELNFRNGK